MNTDTRRQRSTLPTRMQGKGALLTIVVLAALVALAVLFNPSPDKHRQTIQQAMAQSTPLASLLGLGKLTALVSGYHSVGVASYTELNQKVISVGAFGVVIVLQ